MITNKKQTQNVGRLKISIPIVKNTLLFTKDLRDSIGK